MHPDPTCAARPESSEEGRLRGASGDPFRPNLAIIPVVILTTSDDDRDVRSAYQAQANCYVTKPVDFDRFIEVVRSIENFWFTVVRLPQP
jgi:CheY-like chemotaxis protein